MAQDPKQDVHVTPGVNSVLEKVEYRDEAGNILNEEQVKALEGKVSFSTKYETKTRLIDEAGNDVVEVEGLEEVDASSAGTLAEAEEPSTDFAGEASGAPPKVNVDSDLKKEVKVESSEQEDSKAQPASDANSATAHEEL